MGFIAKLKNLPKHWGKKGPDINVTRTPRQIKEEKERIAIIWFCMAFLLTMFIVGHLYQTPVMLYDKNQKHFGCLPKNSNEITTTSRPIISNDLENGSSDANKSLQDAIMVNTMKDSLGFKTENGTFTTYSNMKFFFQTGLISGGISLGHIVDFCGRRLAFRILSRSFIIFVLLMSISRTIATTGICWFFLAFTLVTNYHMIYINSIEKFSDLYEKPNDEEDETQKTRYKKYKYRMYLLLGFGFTWYFSRLFSLLIPYLTQDWTLVLQWFAIVFSIIYYFFGDFLEKHYEDADVLRREKELGDEDCEGLSFYQALRAHPIMAMNLFIVSFNWFAVCHNLFGLILGWSNLSSNLLENMSLATALSFLAQPIKYAVCMAIRRKVIPYSITMFSSGIIIMAMLAFEHCGNYKVNPRFIAAHAASVLLSVSISILELLLYESFPKKYRIHAAGIASASGRLGILIAGILSQTGLFKTDFGPGFGGSLSIVAAILSRILPDLTSSRMPKTQAEIEKEQFPNRNTANQSEPSPQSMENGVAPLQVDHTKNEIIQNHEQKDLTILPN